MDLSLIHISTFDRTNLDLSRPRISIKSYKENPDPNRHTAERKRFFYCLLYTSRGFDLAVRDRGENIELMFSTAFTSLIQNLETKEVKGVVAKGADGKEIRIKANKGVLLACGGYENNLQMQRDFHGMDVVYTGGTPGNTGDGIHALMNTCLLYTSRN